eukprot:4997805-Amphidinium_carterae.1
MPTQDGMPPVPNLWNDNMGCTATDYKSWNDNGWAATDSQIMDSLNHVSRHSSFQFAGRGYCERYAAAAKELAATATQTRRAFATVSATAVVPGMINAGQ